MSRAFKFLLKLVDDSSLKKKLEGGWKAAQLFHAEYYNIPVLKYKIKESSFSSNEIEEYFKRILEFGCALDELDLVAKFNEKRKKEFPIYMNKLRGKLNYKIFDIKSHELLFSSTSCA